MRPSFAFALLLPGCSVHYLQFATPQPQTSALIRVHVVDNRLSQKGGEDRSVIGTQAGAFNLPMDIRARSEREPAEVVGEALTIGATNAVWTARTEPTEIEVDMSDLWCAPVGPLSSTATFRGNLTIAKAKMELAARATALNCARAYRALLEALIKNAASSLQPIMGG